MAGCECVICAAAAAAAAAPGPDWYGFVGIQAPCCDIGGGVLQAAVSARLQIFGFDAGSGTPQSLLVWFFEFDSISSLIAALCGYAFIMAA